MPANELLEEIWRIKDQLSREANGDIGKFCDQLREFTASHPVPGPIIRHPGGVRAHFDEVEAAAGAAREKPEKYGN